MDSPESEKKDVRRPMNAFLIFCKRHRAIVRDKHPDLDNRSVTKILGDLWANLGEKEKSVYTKLAKQYKDAFMKANPDYKWYNPEKVLQPPTKMTTRPTNTRVLNGAPEISLDGKIMPGKLADPSNMGGLNLLLMAGQQFMTPKATTSSSPEKEKRVTSPEELSPKSALLELAEMCANELQLDKKNDDMEVQTAKSEPKTSVCTPEKSPKEEQSSDPGEVFFDGTDKGKPKSKVTKWKMKKSVEFDSQAAVKFEKAETGTELSKLFGNPDLENEESESVSENDSQKKSPEHELPNTEGVTFPRRAMSEGDNSSEGAESMKCKRFRRMSSAETLAGCLSEQNEYPIQTMDSDGGSVFIDSDGMNKISEDSAEDAKFKVKVKMKKKPEEEIKEEMETKESFPSEAMNVKENKMPKGCAEVHEITKLENKMDNFGYEKAGKLPEKKSPVKFDFEDSRLKEKIDIDINTVIEDQEMQPLRKSRRRNRGQRYQELIDEGIIQPSKERLAARRAEKTFTGGCAGESLLMAVDSVYDDEVVEIKQPVKRSVSETEIGDERKYKTGDFDLEAHIAVLPPCSLDQYPKGRKSGKMRHNSEGSPRKMPSSDIAQTLILPPHVKLRSQEKLTEPLTGSRKRKARKHTITHLLLTTSDTDHTPSEETQNTTSKDKQTSLPANATKNRDRVSADIFKPEDKIHEGSQERLGREKTADSSFFKIDKSKSVVAKSKIKRPISELLEKKVPSDSQKQDMEDVSRKFLKVDNSSAETGSLLLKTGDCDLDQRSGLNVTSAAGLSDSKGKQKDCSRSHPAISSHNKPTGDVCGFDFKGLFRIDKKVSRLDKPGEKFSSLLSSGSQPYSCEKKRLSESSNQNLDCAFKVDSASKKAKTGSGTEEELDKQKMHLKGPESENSEKTASPSICVAAAAAAMSETCTTSKQEGPSREVSNSGQSVAMAARGEKEAEVIEESRSAVSESPGKVKVFSSVLGQSLQPDSTSVARQPASAIPIVSDVPPGSNLVAMETDPATTATSDVAVVTGPSDAAVTTTCNDATKPNPATVLTGAGVTVTTPAISLASHVAMVTTTALSSFAAVPYSAAATTTSTTATTTSNNNNNNNNNIATTNQVIMVTSSASATCAVMNSVSMVTTPASTVMNPVAMVTNPVTAVASPVSAVSSPVTAVCS